MTRAKPNTTTTTITAIPKPDVPARLAALPGMPIGELKAEWRSLFGTEPPPYNRRFLESRLSYRIQELAYGGLRPETIARLEALGGPPSASTPWLAWPTAARLPSFAIGHLTATAEHECEDRAGSFAMSLNEADTRYHLIDPARELEAQAAAIDAAVFDLKAVNPNAVTLVDERTPQQIIASIEAQGRIVADALARLSALLEAQLKEASQ